MPHVEWCGVVRVVGCGEYGGMGTLWGLLWRGGEEWSVGVGMGALWGFRVAGYRKVSGGWCGGNGCNIDVERGLWGVM